MRPRYTKFSTDRALFSQRSRKPISSSAIMSHFSTVASPGEFSALSLNVLPANETTSFGAARPRAICSCRGNNSPRLKYLREFKKTRRHPHTMQRPLTPVEIINARCRITNEELYAKRVLPAGSVTILNVIMLNDRMFASFLQFLLSRVYPRCSSTLRITYPSLCRILFLFAKAFDSFIRFFLFPPFLYTERFAIPA